MLLLVDQRTKDAHEQVKSDASSESTRQVLQRAAHLGACYSTEQKQCRTYYKEYVFLFVVTPRFGLELKREHRNLTYQEPAWQDDKTKLKRKRIIHKAKEKEQVFQQIIQQRYEEKGNLKYTLVYVPEGAKPDDDTSDVFDSSETVKDDDYSANYLNELSDGMTILPGMILEGC